VCYCKGGFKKIEAAFLCFSRRRKRKYFCFEINILDLLLSSFYLFQYAREENFSKEGYA
jgi:hypothetical protein